MKLSWTTVELPLEFTFRISRGSSSNSRTIILQIQYLDYTAHGEAVFSKFYGEDENTVSNFYSEILKDQILENLDPFNNQELQRRLSLYKGNWAAKAGLDIAFYDLRSQICKLPLYRFLGLDPSRCPASSYTIGLADLDTIELKTRTALDRGYDILKVKLGSKEDVDIIKTIRKLAPKARIRVDANAAWDLDSALGVLNEIKSENIEFVEEPLQLQSPKTAYQELYKRSPLPIMADESCHRLEDIQHCSQYFHMINIKQGKAGGITEALRMISAAKALNMPVMLGCFTETSISIAAFAHISPLVDFADLDGSLLLANDPYKIDLFEANQIKLGSNPGLGFRQ